MIQKTMLAYEARTKSGKPTFRLLPITNECVFIEGMYDPETKSLIILNKCQTPIYYDKPRYDAKGKMIGVSKELHPSFFEHVISEKDDIENFIAHQVVNTKHEALKILEA